MEAPHRLLVSLRPEVLAWLRFKSGSAALAEEIFQQASLRALERIDQLRDPRQFASWFKQIARNTLQDEWRRQSRWRPLLEQRLEQPIQQAHFDASESCRCVLNVLYQIPPQYAEVLNAVDIQGQAVKQVAQDLGIAPNALSVRLYRARKALRRRLLQTCGTDSTTACQDCSCE